MPEWHFSSSREANYWLIVNDDFDLTSYLQYNNNKLIIQLQTEQPLDGYFKLLPEIVNKSRICDLILAAERLNFSKTRKIFSIRMKLQLLINKSSEKNQNILFLPKGKGKNKILTRLEVKKFLPAGRLIKFLPARRSRKGKNFFTFPRVRIFTSRRVRILFFPAPLGKNSILINLTKRPKLYVFYVKLI